MARKESNNCDLSMFMIMFTSCFRWVGPMDGDVPKNARPNFKTLTLDF